MTNLNILETFRTKEELLNYFDEIGQSITEEEIENLKKNYEQTEGITGSLSLQQLEDVAGGASILHNRSIELHKQFGEIPLESHVEIAENNPFEHNIGPIFRRQFNVGERQLERNIAEIAEVNQVGQPVQNRRQALFTGSLNIGGVTFYRAEQNDQTNFLFRNSRSNWHIINASGHLESVIPTGQVYFNVDRTTGEITSVQY